MLRVAPCGSEGSPFCPVLKVTRLEKKLVASAQMSCSVAKTADECGRKKGTKNCAWKQEARAAGVCAPVLVAGWSDIIQAQSIRGLGTGQCRGCKIQYYPGHGEERVPACVKIVDPSTHVFH